MVAALGCMGGTAAFADNINQCASFGSGSSTIANTVTDTLTADTGSGTGCTIGETTFSNFAFYGATIPAIQ